MDPKDFTIAAGHGRSQPDLLRTDTKSQTIDLDSIFTRDVTNSGSFDLRTLRNLTFGRILESIPIPTLVVDADHTILFANEACGKIGGIVEDLVGRSFVSLFSGLIETQKAIELLKQILSDRKTRSFETLISLEGKMSYCRLNFRSVRVAKQRSVLCLIEDLTAAKRQVIMTEKYQQLVQMFPIGIAEFSLHGSIQIDADRKELLDQIFAARIVGANQEFAKLVGRLSVDEIRGISLKRLLPSQVGLREIYIDWIRDRLPVRTIESKEMHHSAAIYYENTLVANIKHGYFLSFWLMRNDITHRKRIEEDLRASREMLEEKVRERTAELMVANQKLIAEIEERHKTEEKLELSVDELRAALRKVKTLSGLLPICASCKKIRDDQGYWTQVEVYLSKHSEADFTHSICPECAQRLYPSFYGPDK